MSVYTRLKSLLQRNTNANYRRSSGLIHEVKLFTAQISTAHPALSRGIEDQEMAVMRTTKMEMKTMKIMVKMTAT
jgi:hypothetical protein